MMPMTTPDSTYCDNRVRSMATDTSTLWCHNELPRLELRWEDNFHLGKRLLGLGVLGEQHWRTPLLPVGILATRKADSTIPALEFVGQQGLDQVGAFVTVGGVESVCQQDHLGVAIEGAIDRLLLELLQILLPERLAPLGELHGRVVVHNEGEIIPLVAEV